MAAAVVPYKLIRRLFLTCIGAWVGAAAVCAACLALDYGQGSGPFGDKTGVLLPLALGSPAGALAMLYVSVRKWDHLALCAVGAFLGLVLGVFLLDYVGGKGLPILPVLFATPILVGLCSHTFHLILLALRCRAD